MITALVVVASAASYAIGIGFAWVKLDGIFEKDGGEVYRLFSAAFWPMALMVALGVHIARRKRLPEAKIVDDCLDAPDRGSAAWRAAWKRANP